MFSILHICEDINRHMTLKALFAQTHTVHFCNRLQEAVKETLRHNPDVVVFSIRRMTYEEQTLLQQIGASNDEIPIIVLSESRDPTIAVRAMRAGAYNYLSQPIDWADLNEALNEILNFVTISPHKPEHSPIDTLLGKSRAIGNLKQFIHRCAGNDAPVLLYGETGTGKDVAARIIHTLSSRNGAPFIPINCGAIPPSLFETEMFGTERGAYTDAIKKPGAIEQAQGGTLFIDEIGELPTYQQVKLLRVVEEKTIQRVGGIIGRSADVRIIAATNSNLRRMMETAQFRKDLYYRLAVLVYTIPALRDRQIDIPMLGWHFLRIYSENKKRLTTSALDKLEDHKWPGNIRELRNCIQRAVVVSKGTYVGAPAITFV